MARCTARSKRSGEQCKNHAMYGSTKCRMHGGKSPAGAASPHFRTGRHSRHLPERLAERYQEARADDELLVLRDEIALVDVRTTELLGRVDTGESAERWQAAQKAFVQLRKAVDEGDARGQADAVRDLELALLGGGDHAIWAEIANAIDLRRRLAESERRRLVELQSMITAEKAMVMLAVITDVIRTHVHDPAALAAISHDLRKLTEID